MSAGATTRARGHATSASDLRSNVALQDAMCLQTHPEGIGLPASDSSWPPVFARPVRTTSSHTLSVPHLEVLFGAVPPRAEGSAYTAAVVEENVLSRSSFTGRQRALRHLRELYMLDPARPEFRALRDLWVADRAAGPLMAGLLAFTRDELFRASWPAVQSAAPGSTVTPSQLVSSVTAHRVGTMSTATLAKVGRNTAASWAQTGHLAGRSTKRRVTVAARPAAVAYAMVLGHLAGHRGPLLLGSPWTALLDLSETRLREHVDEAGRRGLIDVRSAGRVLEIDVERLVGADGER